MSGRHSRVRRIALILAAYALATLVMTWPVSLNPGSYQIGAGEDPQLYMWTIGWDTYALMRHPWSVFDANIFFPRDLTLAYSENLLGGALMVLPILWVTGDVLTATNAVALLAVFISAVGGYVLGRQFGLSALASFLCGLVFAFVPPRFARLGQMHLITIHWVPFGLAFFHRYLQGARAADLRWTLGFLSLQALTSGHGAALLLLGAGVIAAWRVATGTPIAAWRRVRDVGVTGLLLLAPAALTYIPYRLAARDVALQRGMDDTGLVLSSYVSSPTHVHQALLGLLPAWDWLQRPPDAYLFPGLVPLALAGLAFWKRGSSPAGGDRWMFLTIGVLTYWMAIGPPLSLWQWVYWLPGLNFIRAPSRFTLLGMLALAALAAIGFDRLTRAWAVRRRAIAGAGIALLLLVECAQFPNAARPFTIEIPAVDRWLATQPGPVAIAEVPVSSSRLDARRANVAVQYMLHTLGHYHPTVFGYSGVEPPEYRGVYDNLIGFPSGESIGRLAEQGVTHVVVHLEYLLAEDRPAFEALLGGFAGSLRLVHADGAGRVYEIIAAPR